MNRTDNFVDILKRVQTLDLWAELGRRFNVKYGKIQMAFHGGKPSTYADVDLRVSIEQEEKKEFQKAL